jgi:putative transcriptional regulator
MMTKKVESRASRLTREILETANTLRDVGILDDADYGKITMRHLGRAPSELAPLSGADIRGLRERARMSQAVFARKLQVTPGYVSQLEREVKRPSGPALVLLHVIRRQGMDAIP